MNIFDSGLPIFIAYLDPGTGSLIIQLLFGAIVGMLVLFRGWIVSFLGTLGIHLGKQDTDEDEDVQDVEENPSQDQV